MTLLFEPGITGKIGIKNRFVRSPGGEDGIATSEGGCTEELIYSPEEGGSGFILSGGSFV